MKIRNINMLARKSTKLVVAVQDSFGKAYRLVSGPVKVGEVISSRMECGKQTLSMAEDMTSPVHYKILASVHINTVRALLRRENSRAKLAPGAWYEVHSD